MIEPIKLEKGIIDGITEATLNKLVEAGITTVQALSVQTPPELAEISGMSDETASKVIGKAQKILDFGFIDAVQLRELRANRTHLKTGCTSLDTLIGGGFESETTSEIASDGGVGKTQICHTLAVLAQRPVEEGGLGGDTAWIDTEDTFTPARIEEIAKARGFDPEDTLKHIHWALAKNSDNQKQLILQLFELVPKYNIKLVIVDSMISHLRGEYVGREMLQGRQGLLGLMLQTLLRVSQSMKVTTVYTNQVMDEPTLFGVTKPTGGHRMAHAAGTRLQLRKGREGVRVAKLIDSLSLAGGEAVFIISEKGIEDVPVKKKEAAP